MKRSPVNIITITTLMIIILSACSLPITVKRIESVNESANGIRYILNRPSYEIGLRFNDKVFDELNTDALIDKKAKECFMGTEIEVILKQNLKGTPLTYEVTSASGFSAIPHIFSDTEIVITTAADATLQSITAGETDKSLEFIQAIAGIALKAAASTKTPEPHCVLFEEKDFIDYAKEHLKLWTDIKNNSKKIETSLNSITADNGKKISNTVTFLREEQKRLEEDLKKIQFNLSSDSERRKYYTLTIDGNVKNKGSDDFCADEKPDGDKPCPKRGPSLIINLTKSESK